MEFNCHVDRHELKCVTRQENFFLDEYTKTIGLANWWKKIPFVSKRSLINNLVYIVKSISINEEREYILIQEKSSYTTWHCHGNDLERECSAHEMDNKRTFEPIDCKWIHKPVTKIKKFKSNLCSFVNNWKSMKRLKYFIKMEISIRVTKST